MCGHNARGCLQECCLKMLRIATCKALGALPECAMLHYTALHCTAPCCAVPTCALRMDASAQA